jgi:hypothetical protein
MRRQQEELEAQDEAAREHTHAQRVERMREQVCVQATRQGGFLTLDLRDRHDSVPGKHPVSIEIPRNPFLLWALGGFAFEAFGKERPEWDVVSPPDFKMPFDNPYHTDWMLGAGLSLEETYDRDSDSLTSLVLRRASEKQMDLTQEWTGAEFVVLARGDSRRHFSGQPVIARPHDQVPAGSIALAKTAGPEYQLAMVSASRPDQYGQPGLIICETGGKLAHLALVGREHGCTVLMVPQVIAKYGQARSVSIDIESGRIYQLL